MSIDPFHNANASDAQAAANGRNPHPLLELVPS